MSQAANDLRVCAACQRANPREAIYCGHCGSQLTGAPARGESFQTFPILALLALHYVTFGLFSMVWVNVFHGSLPKRRPDDPSVGRAVGFLFIPIYSLYWVFFTHLRLCERLNEESARRGLPGRTSRSLVLWTCIVHVLPLVGFVSFLVLYPIVAASLQGQVNELAEAQTPRSAH